MHDVNPTAENMIEINDLSEICLEAIYVIDFKMQCFHSVSGNDLFLCGHSRDKVLQSGYDFYYEIVHKDDLLQLMEIYREILNCLRESDNRNKANYFSCTFRIKNYLRQKNQADYLMVYQKLIPKFIDGEIRYGICLLSGSVMKSAGNLRLYYKNSLYFDEYSFTGKKWNPHCIEHLTERETSVLRLAKQGMNLKRIAGMLCLSYKRLQGITASIYEKLNVHTLEQAVIYATNHLLLYHSRGLNMPQEEIACNKEVKCYKRFTTEILQGIQECLDNGESIRSIAKREGFSEGAIRKKINLGELNGKNRKNG